MNLRASALLAIVLGSHTSADGQPATPTQTPTATTSPTTASTDTP